MCQSKRPDARLELADLVESDRHAALVVGVEPHPAHAGGIEPRELVIADVHGDRHHARARFGVSRLSAAMASRMAELSVP